MTGPEGCLSYANQPIQRWYLNHFPMLCPNHPRAGYQTTSDSSSSPEPSKILQTNCLKLDYTALPCCSHRNYNKGPCPCFYHISLATWPILALLTWPSVLCYAPPLGTYSNKLSFQWQSSPDLLRSLSLTDDKTYILKE